ncbi:MAG: thioredoxin domain-containing protein [Marmoricola sp.]
MANRLATATSPYLLQHASNPVDWWEWGPEAFAEARRRDAPILLSVGYSACHWCHVMAHESFEDPAVAAYLNERFVPVKVDREERPDVDAVYMQATVAMTGNGGWPMTCALDHEGVPFFAGTYFPDRPRHGQPSFRQLLEALSDAWRERRDEVVASAEGIRAHLRRETALAPGAVDDAVLSQAVQVLTGEYDAERGGFGGAPKFPPSMVLAFLLRHHVRLQTSSTTGTQALDMVAGSCTAMARGGLYDQLGGGFARYSVDGGWVVPHFEKMLYDNGQLLALYADWYAVSGDPLAARVVRETAAFLLEEMATPQGGFAAALDADSEGREGTFYVWSPGQLVDVLGPEDGPWAAELLTVTPAGTFEHGTSTLQLRADPADEELPRWLEVRRRLQEAREERTRPARDDKIVAAWNGLAITGLARAGVLLEDGLWVDAAVQAADLLWSLHWVDGRLRRVSRDGVVGEPAGVLDDYGCVADGFLALVEATGDARWLDRAGALLDVALEHFSAPDGGFYDTPDDAEQLVTRPQDPSDNASPSGASAITRALVRYAALTGSGRHRDAAEAALAGVRQLLERAPRFAGWWLTATEEMAAGPVELVVVTQDDADPLARLARATVGTVTLVGAPGSSPVPLARDRGLVDGRSAAYLCRGMVCERPRTSPEDLRAALRSAGRRM